MLTSYVATAGGQARLTRAAAACAVFLAVSLTSPSAHAASAAGGGLQMLFGMVVVLGILGALAWWLKKFGPARAGSSGAVRIVGGAAVGAREKVIVVEVADQWIVVGVAPGAVNALSTMPRQELPAAPVSDMSNAGVQLPASFAGWLKQTMDKRNANK